MKAIMSIQVSSGDHKGAAMSTVIIPYETGMDMRNVVASALVQVLGVTLDKAMALAAGTRDTCPL